MGDSKLRVCGRKKGPSHMFNPMMVCHMTEQWYLFLLNIKFNKFYYWFYCGTHYSYHLTEHRWDIPQAQLRQTHTNPFQGIYIIGNWFFFLNN